MARPNKIHYVPPRWRTTKCGLTVSITLPATNDLSRATCGRCLRLLVGVSDEH